MLCFLIAPVFEEFVRFFSLLFMYKIYVRIFHNQGSNLYIYTHTHTHTHTVRLDVYIFIPKGTEKWKNKIIKKYLQFNPGTFVST